MLLLSGLAFLADSISLATFIAEMNELPSIKNYLIRLVLIALFGGLGIFFSTLARSHHYSAIDKMLQMFISLFLLLFIISYFIASTTLFSPSIELGYYIKLVVVVIIPAVIAVILPMLIQRNRLSRVYIIFSILCFASILLFSIQIAMHFFRSGDLAVANFIYQLIYLSMGLSIGVWLYKKSILL